MKHYSVFEYTGITCFTRTRECMNLTAGDVSCSCNNNNNNNNKENQFNK